MIGIAGPRITEERTIDDGTTSGKTILIDENGGRWEPTSMSKESCGTGDRIGTLHNGRIYT